MGTHTIIFTPTGLQATAEDGETVYEVGLKAGVDIQSICGGKGLCKRCQIEIDRGKHAKFKMDVKADNYYKLSPPEKKAIHDGELPKGRRLSYGTKVQGKLVIDITEN